MDKAPDFESGDCRFESCQVQLLLLAPRDTNSQIFSLQFVLYYVHNRGSVLNSIEGAEDNTSHHSFGIEGKESYKYLEQSMFSKVCQGDNCHMSPYRII